MQVNDICNAAGKELAIETGIQKIRDTWTSLSMELFPYTKGEVSRGFILKSTDEITTAIDENMTALQVPLADLSVYAARALCAHVHLQAPCLVLSLYASSD